MPAWLWPPLRRTSITLNPCGAPPASGFPRLLPPAPNPCLQTGLGTGAFLQKSHKRSGGSVFVRGSSPRLCRTDVQIFGKGQQLEIAGSYGVLAVQAG